jgi:epoxyqueuosine reductase QueG
MVYCGQQRHELVAARLAEMCGIGEINGEFTTPEFGENVMIGAIVTNAELDRLYSTGYEYNEPVKKYTAYQLKNKLIALADKNLVDLFGVGKAETFDKIGNILKSNLDDSQFGMGVIDSTGYPHGMWVSEIVNEDVKIRVPSDYIEDAKSVITIGMAMQSELIENAGNQKSMQIGTYGYYTYQTVYELYFAALISFNRRASIIGIGNETTNREILKNTELVNTV